MTRFRALILPLLLLCCFGLAVGNAPAKTVQFKFAHFIPPNEPGAEVGLWIAKDLNTAKDSKIKATYFHSGQMGNAIEIVKKVRMGTLQAGFTTGNYLPELSPKFGIATLAYCMNTYGKWEALQKDPAFRKELYESLLGKGLRVIDLAYFGEYGFTTTKPVQTLSDLKSFKMRTTQARYPLAFWKALGVNPVPMAWGDVIPALKQGVIDGTDQTDNVVRLRLTDVCKYFTSTKHMIGLFPLVVNEKWWQGLAPEARNQIAATIAADMAKARAASMALSQKAKTALEAKGVKHLTLSGPEMAKFKAAQKTVWKQFSAEIGVKWLDRIEKFTASVKD